MSKQGIWKRPKAATAALALTMVLGGLGVAQVTHHVFNSNPEAGMRFADPNEAPSRTGFAPIVKKVTPAVVNISSSMTVKTSASEDQMAPLFRRFFGEGDDSGNGGGGFNMPRNMPRNLPRGERQQALGSGVIVTPEGVILTNNHVIDKATDIKVTLADKREYKAHVIGADPKTDIAILKIDATNLPSVVIGDSSKVQVGDYALAVGDPFGVGQTVTMGIVSALGRTGLGIEQYEDFIQTDAPINPGNSGGALVNDRGELVGINTAILAHGSEGNQGIGFAVPVNLARNVMDQILKTGKVTRAYLGILPQDVTPAIAKAFGQPDTHGALIGDVTPNSPAQRAGLQKGDIIVEMNGKSVSDANQLRMIISMMPTDSVVHLKVSRDGATKDFTVTLAEMPTEQAEVKTPSEGTQSALKGVNVENLDAQTAQQVGVPPATAGVVVTSIDPDSPAADSGLQRGDVIQEVNRKPIKNTSDFAAALRNSKPENLLLVNRQGNTLYVAV